MIFRNSMFKVDETLIEMININSYFKPELNHSKYFLNVK